MIKIASQALGAITDFLQEHPKTTMGLLGGGLGALGGVLATGDSDEDETPEDRTKRRLKNALILGGLGAGAGTLLSSGVETLNTAIPASVTTPEETLSAFGHPAVVGTAAAAGGAVGGSALRNALQKDLETKVRAISDNLPHVNVKIPEKASLSQLRTVIPEIVNATKPGSVEYTQLLHRLLSHFDGIGEEKAFDQMKKLTDSLQNYGISTASLEKNFADDVVKEFEKIPAWKRGLMKFLRRNKYTAGGAALVGLGAAGIASLFRD